MKYKDIERMASDAAREYMDDGWMLEMNASCFSDCKGVHFLSRDGERIAVGIRTPDYSEKDRRGWNRRVKPVLMFISRAPKRSFDWLDPENVICEKVLFEVGDDWYIEDELMAVAAVEKIIERFRSGDSRSVREFHPTKAFLDKHVRQRRGWKTVKPTDVIIHAQDGAYWIRKDCGNRDWFTVKFPRKR